MGIISHGRQVDLERLGGTLIVGAAIILAIRTARREPAFDPRGSNRDWDAEIHFAIDVTSAILMYATTHHAELFRQKTVTFTDGIHEEDVQL